MKIVRKKIDNNLYRKITDVMTIFCVDAVLIHKGKFILVKRKNKPLQGKWWVPGGRVLKGENVFEAVRRKIKEELGIKVKNIKLIGFFEGFFKENQYGLKSGTHSVSIVFKANPISIKGVIVDSQSSVWKFSQSLPKDFIIKPFATL